MKRLCILVGLLSLASTALATTDSQALDFEASNAQRVEFPNGTGDSDKRPGIALWAKFESAGADMCFLGGRYYGRELCFLWDYDAGGSYLKLKTNNGGTQQVHASTVAWTPDLDTWYCLIVTGGDGTVKFWVNGALQDTLTGRTTGVYLSTLALNVGQMSDEYGYSMPFDGCIAGIGVWFASSGTFAAGDITTIYNSGTAACNTWDFATGMGSPTHLFTFEEGSGTTTDDRKDADNGTLTGTTGTPAWVAYDAPAPEAGDNIDWWNRRRH